MENGSDTGEKWPATLPEGIPEGSVGLHLFITPTGELRVHAPRFDALLCRRWLAEAAAFFDRELLCMRLEERAHERARGLTLARDLPPGAPGFGGARRH